VENTHSIPGRIQVLGPSTHHQHHGAVTDGMRRALGDTVITEASRDAAPARKDEPPPPRAARRIVRALGAALGAAVVSCGAAAVVVARGSGRARLARPCGRRARGERKGTYVMGRAYVEWARAARPARRDVKLFREKWLSPADAARARVARQEGVGKQCNYVVVDPATLAVPFYSRIVGVPSCRARNGSVPLGR